MTRLFTSIIAAAALIALVVPTSQAMLERSLPSKNVQTRIAKANKVVHKKGTNASSPTGSSLGSASSGSSEEQLCALFGMNCDAVFMSSVNDASAASNASGSANGALQPESTSTGYVDGQISACWGVTCDAEYLSSVNDASAASNASPATPPAPTYNDGAGT